jgi:CubicO group peptidase (beta-lactamase class C family)
MAEAAAGQAYEDLIVERLFRPLGMASAGFGAPGTRERLDQPRGHRGDGSAVEPGPGSDNPPAIAPAGRVHATLSDWAKFAILHLDAARGRHRLLRPATWKRLHERPAPGAGYAMGWGLTERPWGGPVLTHAGSNTMWFCALWMAPEKALAVMTTCNQGGERGEKACDEAAWALIQDELASREKRER